MSLNLTEATRNTLITKSKKAKNYKNSTENRWSNKSKITIANTVKDYNKIDMDTFWKKDILKFDIKINGETNNYLVSVELNKILDNLKNLVTNNKNNLDIEFIKRALMTSLNSSDVKVSCTCLYPDTKIKLLDGSTPTVEEMKKRFDSGEKLYVYSTDEKGDFKPGEVEKVWITGQETRFIKIILDNGKEIKTTLDHLFMLRDGSYVQAQELKENDSLMPMYFSEANGYEIIKLNSSAYGRNSTYKLVAQELKGEEIYQASERNKLQENPMPYEVAIHHKDFNKHNNNPDNLEIMTGWEHWKYHANLSGKNRSVTEKMRKVASENAKKRNNKPTEAMLKQREKWVEAGKNHNKIIADHTTVDYEKQAKIMSETINNYWKNLSVDELNMKKAKQSERTKKAWEKGSFETVAFKKAAKARGKQMHTLEREEQIHQGIINYWNNISEDEKQERAAVSKHNLEKAIEKVTGTKWSEERKHQRSIDMLNESPEVRNSRIKKCFETKVLSVFNSILEANDFITEENYLKYKPKNYPGIDKVVIHFGSFNNAVSYFELNHKIIKIEYLIEQTPIDVYDIKVTKWHNFVVEAGIVLHNCPDFKYRLAYNATKGGYKAGQAETRPSNITNPNNDLGTGCKHVLCVINNAEWLKKISSVINNYINYAKDNMENLYAKYIFPKIYGIPYEKAVQMTVFDFDDNGNEKDKLESDEALINLSNALGKERGKFKPGSNKNPAKK